MPICIKPAFWDMRGHAAEGGVKMTMMTYKKIGRLRRLGPHPEILIAACRGAPVSEAHKPWEE